MRLWAFRDYVFVEAGVEVNPTQRWFDAQGPEVQAVFINTLIDLGATEDWAERGDVFSELRRQHSGLHEIKMEVHSPAKRHYRAPGLWVPAERRFVLFGACLKLGRFTDPPGAFDRALKYKEQLERGIGGLRERL